MALASHTGEMLGYDPSQTTTLLLCISTLERKDEHQGSVTVLFKCNDVDCTWLVECDAKLFRENSDAPRHTKFLKHTFFQKHSVPIHCILFRSHVFHRGMTGTKTPVTIDERECAAAALNEQGFLFQQQMRNRIIFPETGHDWIYEASEYPITARDGSQTRIDLVLRHEHQRGVRICLECKRADPRFKNWIVFDKARGSGAQQYHLETYRVKQRSSKDGDIEHVICHTGVDTFEVFNNYVESTIDRNTKKFSGTDTIEKALVQVMFGHTGMIRKMQEFPDLNWMRSIPVVVTTAQLLKADFDVNKVSAEGFIAKEHLAVERLDASAINYHANDDLAIVELGNTTHPKTDPAADLRFHQTRTVFLVQAQAINRFLKWAGEELLVGLS